MDLYGIVVLAFPYRKMLHWMSLFHRHAGERENGGNVRRRQWACLNFNDFVRDWSKPCEALLDEFDFRPCHLFVHFLTFRRDLTLRASVTVVPMFICKPVLRALGIARMSPRAHFVSFVSGLAKTMRWRPVMRQPPICRRKSGAYFGTCQRSPPSDLPDRDGGGAASD